MSRLVAVVFSMLALAGCSDFSYKLPTIPTPDMAGLDECTAAPAGRSCVTLHLIAHKGTIGLIDNVQVDARFQLAGEYVARRITSFHDGAVDLPIAVGMILPLDAGDTINFVVLARNGDTPVAIGPAFVDGVGIGDHGSAAVPLDAAATSYCLDGIKDMNETAIDCGSIGDCPSCDLGSICVTDDDCANAACLRNPGGGYTCQ